MRVKLVANFALRNFADEYIEDCASRHVQDEANIYAKDVMSEFVWELRENQKVNEVAQQDGEQHFHPIPDCHFTSSQANQVT
jgi:hypothetical protein